MSDLISRHAAIEALQSYSFPNAPNVESGIKVAINLIETLPFAQPEIIRCGECKYQRKGENDCEAWNVCAFRPWLYVPIQDDDFCSHAKRREDTDAKDDYIPMATIEIEEES